jgi:hypothetical protein
METVEMPLIEDLDQTAWSGQPPVKFEEQEMDIAAFALWRSASMPDVLPDDDGK